MINTKPMPEDVRSHAMFYMGWKHEEDDRECCYHVRLDKWVVTTDLSLECTREHPKPNFFRENSQKLQGL